MKIRQLKLLPDLRDDMTIEDIHYIYGTLEIDKIQCKSYTISNHAKLMKSCGILIDGLKLANLGKCMSIFISLLSFIRQITLSFGVVVFR